MPGKAAYQSDKLREKKRRQRIWRFVLTIVGAMVVLGALVYWSGHTFFRINQLIVNDLQYIERADAELVIKEQLEGRYIGLFARANSFIFPRREIERALQESFPSIKDVDADFRGRKVIRITIEEYEPVARWCDIAVTPAPRLAHVEEEEQASALPQIPESRNGQTCYYMNSNAVIFTEAPAADLEQYVTFYGYITNDPLRDTYVSPEKVGDLLQLIKLIRRVQIVGQEVWTTTGEVFAIVTEPGTKLYLDSEDDVVSVFSNLQTVIDRDAINAAQFANINYIDLRFGNRVFYKLR